MNPLRTKPLIAGATLAAALSLALPAFAQQQNGQDQQKQQGEAVVRQRTGPSVEVKPGQTARIIVLFPDAGSPNSSAGYGQQQQQGQGRIEVVAVQGPAKQQAGQQGQQQGGQQPESEIVFAKDKAVNGLVVFGGEDQPRQGANAQGNSLTFMAEMGGQALKIDQAGGGQQGKIYVMTCKMDPQQVQQMMKQQDQQAGQQGGQQAQTAGGQEMTDEQKKAQQDQQQKQQQQQQEQMKKMQDQVHAVIFVYLDGEPTQQEGKQGQGQ